MIFMSGKEYGDYLTESMDDIEPEPVTIYDLFSEAGKIMTTSSKDLIGVDAVYSEDEKEI